jgi:multisubunit Na+/H+ antiporter MnhB subunit
MMRTITKVVPIIILLALFMAMAASFDFGRPFKTAMDDYFIEHGQEQVGTNNIITTIVFDYRGFDTLGEASVLLTAVLGVGLLFRRFAKGEEDEAAEEEDWPEVTEQ